MRLRNRKMMLLAAVGLSAAAVLPGVAVAAPPPNNDFSAAQPLSGTSTTSDGTTVGATLETGEPSHFTGTTGSVWYSWTAPLNSNVRVDTCTGQQANRIQVYTGSSVGALTPVDVTPDANRCAGSSDANRFHAVTGTTYRIVVIEYVTKGSFTLALSAPPAPANDYFADAQNIGSLPARIAATTTDTTVEPGEDGYFGRATDAQSVWYRWTAPKDTRMWLDNCGADYGTKVRLYTGAALNSLSPVDEGVAATPETRYGADCYTIYNLSGQTYGGVSSFNAKAGTTYRIQVLLDDLNYDPGFHLGLREARFDGAISQTSSRKSIHKGQSVTYSVTVRNLGSLPMSPEIDLLTSKPHKLARPVVGSRYLSLKPSQGSCRRVKFFAVHPGALCDTGQIAPGGTVKITAKVRPSGSLSHWVGLDYLHGGEGNNKDDNPRNDPFSAVTTTVTGAHH